MGQNAFTGKQLRLRAHQGRRFGTLGLQQWMIQTQRGCVPDPRTGFLRGQTRRWRRSGELKSLVIDHLPFLISHLECWQSSRLTFFLPG